MGLCWASVGNVFEFELRASGVCCLGGLWRIFLLCGANWDPDLNCFLKKYLVLIVDFYNRFLDCY